MAKKAEKTRAGKGNDRLTKELRETAGDMRASGILTKAAHEKIALRHIEGWLTVLVDHGQ